MKYFYTLAITILMVSFSKESIAQISFTPNTKEVNGFTDKFDVEIHSKFQNESNQDTFRWVRTRNTLTSGWESAVCDNNQCHDVIVDSAVFVLNKSESFDFIMHFYPYGNKGKGSMDIYVYAIHDPSVNASGTFSSNVWTLGNQPLTTTGVLYPNPAANTIYFNHVSPVSSVRLFSLDGTVVLQNDNLLGQNHLEVSSLAQGVYTAEFNSSEGIIRERIIISK